MRHSDGETGAEEVFLMRSQLSKLQLLTAALKQENARLADENRVLKRALAATSTGTQPYTTTTIHAGHAATTSNQQAPAASAEMMDYIEGEVLMLQEQLHKTRLKLQQAEAAQGQWTPAHKASQPQRQSQQRVAASPVNRRLLQCCSPSRVQGGRSPSPWRSSGKNARGGKLGHSPSPGKHRVCANDLKQRASSRGRHATGQRRAINSKTINLLHSGLPTVLSSRT